MRDLDLIGIVVSKVEEVLATRQFPYVVVQKDQSTQQGIPSQGTVFFEILFNDYYGHPTSEFGFNELRNEFELTEKQMMLTTFQFSCLIPQDPRNPQAPTAKDVLDYVKRAISGRYMARQFVKSGINIFRVSQVRAGWFEDDNHQFENHPTFDLEIAHSSDVVFATPKIDKVEPKEVPPYGSGTFPV